MYFDNLNQIVYMQGHGAYVWISFGLFWLLLGLNIWQAKAQHKKLYNKIKDQARYYKQRTQIDAATTPIDDNDTSSNTASN